MRVGAALYIPHCGAVRGRYRPRKWESAAPSGIMGVLSNHEAGGVACASPPDTSVDRTVWVANGMRIGPPGGCWDPYQEDDPHGYCSARATRRVADRSGPPPAPARLHPGLGPG